MTQADQSTVPSAKAMSKGFARAAFTRAAGAAVLSIGSLISPFETYTERLTNALHTPVTAPAASLIGWGLIMMLNLGIVAGMRHEFGRLQTRFNKAAGNNLSGPEGYAMEPLRNALNTRKALDLKLSPSDLNPLKTGNILGTLMGLFFMMATHNPGIGLAFVAMGLASREGQHMWNVRRGARESLKRLEGQAGPDISA